MATVTIILGYRASGPSDAPVPNAEYDSMEQKAVTTASNSALTADANDQFWFVTPEDGAVRVLQRTAGAGSDVSATTGWYVGIGERWEAKADNGKTISLIAV